MPEEQTSVAVIGAGQAGLATSYHLRRRHVFHTVFEAESHPGSHWRRRWDSLRLHTPAQLSNLPGLPLGTAHSGPPTKDEIADYLVRYARTFDLPIRSCRRVLSVQPNRRGFVVKVSNELDGTVDIVHAIAVVWAAGAHAAAAVPWYADRLTSTIQQLTAASYRNPAQISGGPVLVVGAGNSGAEIAFEVARSHPTFKVLLSGRDVGTDAPLDRRRFIARQFLRRAGLGLVQHRAPGHGDPWVRIRRHDLVAAGVENVAKVAGVKNGWPRLVTDEVIPTATVIWCTGLRPEAAVDGLPPDVLESVDRHGGTTVPGFYAVGLPARSGLNSHLIAGVGADADRTVSHLITHTLYA